VSHGSVAFVAATEAHGVRGGGSSHQRADLLNQTIQTPLNLNGLVNAINGRIRVPHTGACDTTFTSDLFYLHVGFWLSGLTRFVPVGYNRVDP
jgi:hypothetical protein